MSAYGFFCIDKRPELAEEYKSNPRELMKALGESWKKAKKGDKQMGKTCIERQGTIRKRNGKLQSSKRRRN